MRAFPMVLAWTLAGTACTGTGGSGDTENENTACERSLDAYCDGNCPVLVDRVPPTCSEGDLGLVERCGDEGSMWVVTTGDDYLFEVDHRYFDVTGALVAYVHTEDAEQDCGGFSIVYGTPPGCETSMCTYAECGAAYMVEPPPACSGGADPPPR